MAIIKNGDAYFAVLDLAKTQGVSDKKLESYLRGLLAAAGTLSSRPAFSIDEMLGLLQTATTIEPATFDEEWLLRDPPPYEDAQDFQGWSDELIAQIVDLREMSEAGIMDNEERYFGIDSSRGRRWYNFDTATYLECAAAGSISGWDGYNPGNVVVETHQVGWTEFESFISCGRVYE